MSEKEKEVLIIGFMESDTSYLREELSQLSGLSLVDVIQQLEKGKGEGRIEMTKLGDHEFWSIRDQGNNEKHK